MVGVLKKTSHRSKGAGQLMMTIALIALAAGSASALMFASIISGALISLVLFYLAPLPLLGGYPVGRILLWAAGFAALTTTAALLTLGSDAATITGALRRGLLRIMGVRNSAPSAETGHLIHAAGDNAPARAAP